MTDPTESTIAAQVAALEARQEQLAQQARSDSPQQRARTVTAAERARLAADGIPTGVIAPGTTLPDARMITPFAAETTLYHAIPEGHPAVIVFYRGEWCPYCNLTLHTYQTALAPELDRRGVELVAISPQAPDNSLTMKEKYDLTFTVLSDPGLVLARQLGIVTTPSQEARDAVLEAGLDYAATNQDDSPELPMPTTLIIDAARNIRWVDAHPDYSTRSEPGQVIHALDVLNDADKAAA